MVKGSWSTTGSWQFMVNDSWQVMVNDSWFRVHGLQLVHGEWFTVNGSWFMVNCSRLMIRKHGREETI